jgi:hypothetical protein
MASNPPAPSLNERAIRAIRSEMGIQRMSGAKLARLLDWRQTFCSRRLTGQQVLTLTEFEQIAHQLDVPIEHLLFDPSIARRRKAS